VVITLAVRLAEIKIEMVGNTLAVLEAMALFDTLAERHSEKEFNPHTFRARGCGAGEHNS